VGERGWRGGGGQGGGGGEIEGDTGGWREAADGEGS